MSAKKEHKRLTISQLRNFQGFEGYSDEQAEETIRTLENLSVLFYKLHMKNKAVNNTFKLTHQEESKVKKKIKKEKRNESGKDGDQPHAA